ncbi:hypothetical protein BH23CHL2_BH23CHL2_28490 [soil metagenome]
MPNRMTNQDWLFAALIVIGVVIAGYSIATGHVTNGLLVLGGILIGALVRFAASGDPAPDDGRPLVRFSRWIRGRDESGSGLWLRSGIIAGFAATVVMSIVLVLGYLTAGLFADQEASTVSRWFYGLTHNSLTDETFEIPLGAYSLNLLAGVIWSLVYAGVFEPRMSGSGWWRGAKFSLLPWLLSLVVFFPLVGAGFFGASLGAGPLPVIGNLILHLTFGATLGSIYAIPENSGLARVEANPQLAGWINEGLAAGLAGGFMIGLIVGALLGLAVDFGGVTSTEVTLAGAVSGVLCGIMVGPLIGLEVGSSRSTQEAS